MLNRYTDRVRVLVHDVLSSEKRDRWKPAKALREVLGTANDLAGRPFCSEEELARRRERARAAAPAGATHARAPREPAPVMLYFDGKDHRTRKKMEELLQSRDIRFQVLDCTDDEATRSWATATAKQDEFPLLFIAGEPIGGLHELTQLDVNGGLRRRVFGD
jgi:glutaredoxin